MRSQYPVKQMYSYWIVLQIFRKNDEILITENIVLSIIDNKNMKRDLIFAPMLWLNFILYLVCIIFWKIFSDNELAFAYGIFEFCQIFCLGFRYEIMF